MLEKRIQEFLDHLRYERNASQHTLRNYASDLEQFREFLVSIGKGNIIDVSEIDHLTIREWMSHLYGLKKKKSSIARKLASLRAFFQFLVREGILEKNPAKIVSRPRVEQKIPKVLSVEEVFRFLETPDPHTDLGKRDRAILEFLYATGVRVGELVSLNLRDIDLQQKTVRVTGKRRKQRIVFFHDRAAQALKLYLAEVRPKFLSNCPPDKLDEQAVFLNYQGTRITTRSVARMIEKYIQQCADLHHISPHILRHTFATHLYEQNMNLREVQELLGHALISTTQIYAQVSTEKITKEYDKSHPKA
jgi:integrase/recombinase XerC